MKRIIAIILTALMLMSTFTFLVNAKGSDESTTSKYTYNTSNSTPTMDYEKGEWVDPETKEVVIVDTEEEKLATMDLRMEANGYQLYIDAYSGEVAVVCMATGEKLFTNPVTASAYKIEETKKQEFLSQILIDYVDITNNEQERSYTSFADAVVVGTKDNPLPSQIIVKPIKNGIRVDYSIGRVDSRYLVPERISKVDFEEKIKNVILNALDEALKRAEESGDNAAIKKAKREKDLIASQLEGFFKLFDLESDAAKKSSVIREDWLKKYPMIKHTPIYAFTGATKREYRAIEKIIKAYCPDYTYEDLDNGHLELEYEPSDKAEALFTVALEYRIEETCEGSGEYGLTVRLPANGIRFDESAFRLTNIQILPYMGSGLNPNPGYTFFPDGTGTLFDAEELALKKSDTYFYGTVYGDDYAYYNLGTGAPHNEVVRYPVFGVVETQPQADGTEKDRGFLAIIEEGDAMTKLISYHTTYYNTVRMEVNPRPSDTYNLSDAISVSGLSTWTVVSPRKYTGDFKLRYIMLTEDEAAEKAGLTKNYEPTYMGMAEAYRDYLEGSGVLTRLTEDDVKEDIPLYIETFGCTVTTEKFLSIPYDTEIPLTSFGDIQKMYDELSEEGVKNINFILTGYTKGGLENERIPYKLDWDKAVEKELDFEELLADAKSKGYGIYPDFDFVFCGNNQLFDGLSLNKHAIKTIDDRYTSKREYSATRQTFINYFELAMSPAYFDRFYTKLTDNYLEYDPIGISVSTLGSYLSSDFDEDEPYNREDSKDFTKTAFEYLDSKYNKVLTSGGNVYSWKYVDYITDAATDSSRHARSCATVPFLGIVLHGYVEFAGSAINMEGNIDYALLRAIENGASLKFILSYRNTQKLKQYYATSVYYSVRYDIWKEDLIARYKEINEVLKGVQTSVIVDHYFIDDYAVRIPDDNEIANDAMAALLAATLAEKAENDASRETLRQMIQTVRKNLLLCEQKLPNALNNRVNDTDELTIKDLFDAAVEAEKALDEALQAMNDAKDALDKFDSETEEDNTTEGGEPVVQNTDGEGTEGEGTEGEGTEGEGTEGEGTEGEGTEGEGTEGEGEQEPEVDRETLRAELQKTYDEAVATVKSNYDAFKAAVEAANDAANELVELYDYAKANIAVLDSDDVYTEDIRNQLKALVTSLEADYTALKAYIESNKALGDKVESFVTENPDLFETEENTEVEPDDTTKENVFNKYAVSVNSVVYEKFENGTVFVLNFNNYAIKVLLDGAYYTVDAYGYIIID
jgi:hypothetical protein